MPAIVGRVIDPIAYELDASIQRRCQQVAAVDLVLFLRLDGAGA